MRLILNNQDVTEIADLDDISLELGLNNSGEYGITTSSDIDIKPNDIIKNQFFVPGGKYTIMEGNLYIDSIDYNLPVKILPDGVEICGCDSSVALTTENDINSRCYKRFKAKSITDPGFIQWLELNHKVNWMIYNLDLSGLLMNVLGFFTGILILPGLIATVLGKSQEYKNLIAGTSRSHASYKLTDMLEYFTDDCEIELEAPLLYEDPYDEIYILPGAIANGKITFSAPDNKFPDINLSNMTVKEFLDEFVKLFNAEWRLQDGKLVIQHWTYFKNQAVNLGYEEDFCLTIHPQCAATKYHYTDDSDITGNNSAPDYDEIVDFVQNELYTQKEFCEIPIRLGRTQGTDSRVQDPSKVKFIETPGNGVLPAILFPEITKGIFNNPKVVVKGEGKDNLYIPVFRDHPDGGDYRQTNYPLSFDEDDPESLYNKFYYTDDPKNGLILCYQVSTLELCLTKDLLIRALEAFRAGKTVYFETEFGNLYFNNATVTFKNETIRFQNGIIYG